MKFVSDLKTATAAQSNIAKALGITRQRVSQLAQEGVMVKDDAGQLLVVKSIVNFVKYQLGNTDNEDGRNGTLDLRTEQARHERAKRELAELKLAKMEGKLYDAKVVEMVMVEMLSNLRTQLLGIPSKMAPLMEGKAKEEIYTELTDEIESKLMELSEYKPELFMDNEWEGDIDEVS